MKQRLSKEEALSFLLTHIVVEQAHNFEMNQLTLFNLLNMATEAQERLSKENGLIPHEVIEQVAVQFIKDH